jgi:uncharacterized membrane protein
MQMTVQVPIEASAEAIWQVITDIENASQRVSAIEEVEVLEKPAAGLVGLKWRETRTMFGKTATEVMWITDAVENESYDVRAESHGSIYESTVSIAEESGVRILRMEFGARPQNFIARLMSATMGWMFKGATEKALLQDLQDLKTAIEAEES